MGLWDGGCLSYTCSRVHGNSSSMKCSNSFANNTGPHSSSHSGLLTTGYNSLRMSPPNKQLAMIASILSIQLQCPYTQHIGIEKTQESRTVMFLATWMNLCGRRGTSMVDQQEMQYLKKHIHVRTCVFTPYSISSHIVSLISTHQKSY